MVIHSEEFVKKWCDRNGYTDPQPVCYQWWAIPPMMFVPEPISHLMPQHKPKPTFKESISRLGIAVIDFLEAVERIYDP